MTRMISIALLVLFVSGAVAAGPTAYVGIFTDDAHSVCSQYVPAPYAMFVAWVWVLPSDNGMICSEFMVGLPPWILNTGIVSNGMISVALGDPINGASVCFAECQYDWTWIYQISCLPVSAVDQGFITVMEHPDVGAVQVANCLPGYPLEELVPLNYLAVNTECVIATENASWGAIKSMVGR